MQHLIVIVIFFYAGDLPTMTYFILYVSEFKKTNQKITLWVF